MFWAQLVISYLFHIFGKLQVVLKHNTQYGEQVNSFLRPVYGWMVRVSCFEPVKDQFRGFGSVECKVFIDNTFRYVIKIVLYCVRIFGWMIRYESSA